MFKYTKEQLQESSVILDALDDRVREVAKEIGFLDKWWGYHDMEVDFSNETIRIIAYDIYYDMPDYKSTTIPFSYLYEDADLHKDAYIIEEEKRKALENEKEAMALEKKERLEYERLRAKFEKA